MKKHVYAEILKINSTPKIMVTNTIKRTGNVYIKPVDSNIKTAIMQSNLNVVTQTTIKPKVLIYNVDSEHTAEELIDVLYIKIQNLEIPLMTNKTPSLKYHI
jgi:hypothetical protein